MDKEAIKKEIRKYLSETYGCPKCQPEVIINEFPTLWKHLLSKGLVTEQDNYQQWFNTAFRTYEKYKIFSKFGIFF